MLLRRITDFILKNPLHSIGTALALAFIPVLGSLGVLIAAFVTLRKSALEGALVFLAVSMPLMIRYVSAPGDFGSDLAFGMFLIAILSNVLIWFFALLLRRSGNWNFLIEAAIWSGVVVVGVVHLFYPDVQQWWEKVLTHYFSDALRPLKSEIGGTEEVQSQFVSTAKYYATGFLAASTLFNALLQIVIARWWQACVYNPGGLRKELHQIRLSYFSGGLFVLLLLLSYFQNEFATDAIPIVYMAFAMSGLSLIHYMIATYTMAGWIWLGLIYLGIIWLFPLSLVSIAIMALFDTGLNFRKRIGKAG